MAKSTKVCKGCGQRKPVRAFYPSSRCRPCFKEAAKVRKDSKRAV